MSEDLPENKPFLRPQDRFFGRRKGPTLSDRKQSLIDEFLPQISVVIDNPLDDNGPPLDLQTLFPFQPRAVWLEIGFGKGEHLAWQAAHHTDVGVIGCEPYMNGVAGLLSYVQEDNINNVRIYGDDARHVIKRLPDASIARVFLLHPDPWPKRRHAQRRFVNRHNLDALARILVDGGEFRVGTDHPIYREWTALQMAQRTDFEWMAMRPDDWLTSPDDWPETRYEAKALEGHPTYFRFKRLPRS